MQRASRVGLRERVNYDQRVMRPSLEQSLIRLAIFQWLEQSIDGGAFEFSRETLQNFSHNGERIPLLDRGRGIRNPRDFDSTLTIMTSINNPYADVMIGDVGIGRYGYQEADSDNAKLRVAFERGDPLVYFHAVRSAVYVPYFPVYVVEDDPVARVFLVALDESLRFFPHPGSLSGAERRYAERVTRQRLHQPIFRAKVMRAYSSTCAVCALKHPDLLDAAHIIGDSEALGVATVNNGLALCKIHHAAFDRNLLGITPSYKIQIDAELLDEIDGPMLRHGLQDMHGNDLHLPARASDLPDRDLLAAKFAAFAA